MTDFKEDIMKFLIPIITGAVIGYITNWLAIRMLFRPHKEIRLFGIRLPFTPGLIPKERERIAKSVGDAVGTHLLTPEVFSESLASQRVKKEIQVWIIQKLKSIKEGKESLEDYMSKILRDNYRNFKESISDKISCIILDYVKKDEIKEKMSQIIEKNLRNIWDRVAARGEAKEIVGEYIYNISNSEELDTFIEGVLGEKINQIGRDERRLNQVIPEEIITKIKDYIYKNDSKIAEEIRRVIETPSIKRGIQYSIMDFVEQSLGKFITMFMKPEFVSEKVMEAILKYVDNPENHIDIALLSGNLIDRLFEKRLSEVFDIMSPEFKDIGSRRIKDIVLSVVRNKDYQRELIGGAEKRFTSSKDDIIKNISLYLSDALGEITLSNEFKYQISDATENILDYILKMPLGNLIGDVSEEFTGDLIGVVLENLGDFIRNRGVSIIEIMDISRMVEDRIKGFDVAFAEEVITEISKKELKAITWLGALLGGIIGVLSPILQSLYK